jgi:hypothetical protein
MISNNCTLEEWISQLLFPAFFNQTATGIDGGSDRLFCIDGIQNPGSIQIRMEYVQRRIRSKACPRGRTQRHLDYPS